MIQTCPKCGKKGQFGYFEEPDGNGVVGMISHKTGKIETVHTPFGNRKVPEFNRCFLTLKELQSTDWFADFLKEREKAFEEYRK